MKKKHGLLVTVHRFIIDDIIITGISTRTHLIELQPTLKIVYSRASGILLLGFGVVDATASAAMLQALRDLATSPPRRRRVCSLTRNTSANMPRFFQVNNVGEPRPRLTALPQWKVSWTSWLSVSSRHGRRSSRLRAKPVCGRPDSSGGANSQAYPSGIYCYRSSTRYLSMPPSWGWLCLLGCEEQTLTSG